MLEIVDFIARSLILDKTYLFLAFWSFQGHIFSPSVGETVDATVASHIYRILLNDELFESLEFIKVG